MAHRGVCNNNNSTDNTKPQTNVRACVRSQQYVIVVCGSGDIAA